MNKRNLIIPLAFLFVIISVIFNKENEIMPFIGLSISLLIGFFICCCADKEKKR
jgi:hypothetical protein